MYIIYVCISYVISPHFMASLCALCLTEVLFGSSTLHTLSSSAWMRPRPPGCRCRETVSSAGGSFMAHLQRNAKHLQFIPIHFYSFFLFQDRSIVFLNSLKNMFKSSVASSCFEPSKGRICLLLAAFALPLLGMMPFAIALKVTSAHGLVVGAQ